MKKSLLTLLMCVGVLYSYAQDIIVKKNGDEIQAKILEIALVEIRYKRFDYQEGPTISIAKREVFMIKYANGTKEVITAPRTPVNPNLPVASGGEMQEPLQQSIKLSGPRVGFTILSGQMVDDVKEEYGLSPFLTQFGWQFETRIFTTASGISGLAEIVPLIGGLEQGKFIPSLSAVMGIRNANGFEFGAGPNVSPTGAGLVLALGTNFQSEGINFPVNLAVVPSKNGTRFSLLFGFNSRRN